MVVLALFAKCETNLRFDSHDRTGPFLVTCCRGTLLSCLAFTGVLVPDESLNAYVNRWHGARAAQSGSAADARLWGVLLYSVQDRCAFNWRVIGSLQLQID